MEAGPAAHVSARRLPVRPGWGTLTVPVNSAPDLGAEEKPMGMEMAELFMDIEEKLAVSLSDIEAQRVDTMGDLVSCVQAKVAAKGRIPCPTGEAFRAIRTALVEDVGVPRKGLRPSTPLSNVLPWFGRRRSWRMAGNHLAREHYALPSLRPVRGVSACFQVMLCLAALVYWLGLVPHPWPRSGGFRAVLALLAVIAGFAVTVNLFYRRLPEGCYTVGQLARSITPPPLDEVQPAVFRLVSERLGVPIEKLSPQTRLIDLAT
jgi:hypothetical protein